MGNVLVFNANPSLGAVGAYPIEASPDAQPDSESDAAQVARDPDVATRGELMQQWIADAMWDVLERPLNVGFAAFCSACIPDSHQYAYSIPASRSAVHWMAWHLHLSKKTWMGALDSYRMADYWFSNRGLEPGALL